jgi:hypothetical protein
LVDCVRDTHVTSTWALSRVHDGTYALVTPGIQVSAGPAGLTNIFFVQTQN